ncbi:hypothetical protein [Streptomyces canus]|uniref:hypothetical protein n=1 Tax=Streptomyces canus TaxID=58343 RepID=UPI002E2A3127|nr:hypothetical protein [Streptomyces canus]
MAGGLVAGASPAGGRVSLTVHSDRHIAVTDDLTSLLDDTDDLAECRASPGPVVRGSS